MVRRLISLIAVAVLVAACAPEEAELTTTTTTTPGESTTTSTLPTTTAPADDDEEGSDDDGTDEPAISEHEVVVRSSGTDGEILWILVEPGDYTDVDLENLIRQLVDESDVTLHEINVFDDLDALEAGRVDPEARTAEEQELVDEHFLVSLVDSAAIRFQGPYEEYGEVAVGS